MIAGGTPPARFGSAFVPYEGSTSGTTATGTLFNGSTVYGGSNWGSGTYTGVTYQSSFQMTPPLGIIWNGLSSHSLVGSLGTALDISNSSATYGQFAFTASNSNIATDGMAWMNTVAGTAFSSGDGAGAGGLGSSSAGSGIYLHFGQCTSSVGGVYTLIGDNNCYNTSANTNYWISQEWNNGSSATNYEQIFDMTTWTLQAELSTASAAGAPNYFDFGAIGATGHPTGSVGIDNLILDYSSSPQWPVVPVPVTNAEPSYSPGTGTYANSVSVTISDIAHLASVYYCQDQANTCTPSTLYSGAVTIDTSGTNYLRSLARQNTSWWRDSALLSTSYIINLWSGPYRVNSGYNNQSYGTSVAVAVSVQSTSDILYAWGGGDGVTSAISITDTCGSGGAASTWTAVNTAITNTDSGSSADWWATPGKTGSCTVTFSWTGSHYGNGQVVEIASAGGTPVDVHIAQAQTYGTYNTANSITSTAKTTGSANDYCTGVIFNPNGQGPTINVGTGWNSPAFNTITANSIPSSMFDENVATSGTSIAATGNTTSGQCSGSSCTFHSYLVCWK